MLQDVALKCCVRLAGPLCQSEPQNSTCHQTWLCSANDDLSFYVIPSTTTGPPGELVNHFFCLCCAFNSDRDSEVVISVKNNN